MLAIFLIPLLTVITSGLETLTGFGISTLMVPIMLLFYPVPESLLFVGIIHWFGDIWKLVLFGRGIRWKIILPFAIPGIIASFIGARFMFEVPQDAIPRLLGALLVAYIIFLYLNPTFKVMPSKKSAAAGGIMSGFLAGAFGVGGAVRSAFLTMFDLPKLVFVASEGGIAFFIDSTRLRTYLTYGAWLPTELWIALGICVPLSLVGTALGYHVIGHIPQKYFRTTVASFLLVLGLKLLLFG